MGSSFYNPNVPLSRDGVALTAGPSLSFTRGGNWGQDPTYKYVGQGAGEYRTFPQQSAGSCICCILGLIPMVIALLAAPFLVMLLRGKLTTTQTTTTTWPVPLPVVAAGAPAMMGTTRPPPAPPVPKKLVMKDRYDCSLGTESRWSPGKRLWCCRHDQKGCMSTSSSAVPAPAPAAPIPALISAQEPMTTPPATKTTAATTTTYDCANGDSESWEVHKKVACCLSTGKGCPTVAPPPPTSATAAPPATAPPPPPPPTTQQAPSPAPSKPYDCDAGLSNWEAGWSPAKKDWCCANEAPKGCPVTTSKPYDCEAGYSNWEAGWAPEKKDWCCQNERRGCQTTEPAPTTQEPTTSSPPYDCDAGYANWQAGWSDFKQDWCCQHAQKGCKADATPVASEDAAPAPAEA